MIGMETAPPVSADADADVDVDVEAPPASVSADADCDVESAPTMPPVAPAPARSRVRPADGDMTGGRRDDDVDGINADLVEEAPVIRTAATASLQRATSAAAASSPFVSTSSFSLPSGSRNDDEDGGARRKFEERARRKSDEGAAHFEDRVRRKSDDEDSAALRRRKSDEEAAQEFEERVRRKADAASPMSCASTSGSDDELQQSKTSDTTSNTNKKMAPAELFFTNLPSHPLQVLTSYLTPLDVTNLVASSSVLHHFIIADSTDYSAGMRRSWMRPSLSSRREREGALDARDVEDYEARVRRKMNMESRSFDSSYTEGGEGDASTCGSHARQERAPNLNAGRFLGRRPRNRDGQGAGQSRAGGEGAAGHQGAGGAVSAGATGARAGRASGAAHSLRRHQGEEGGARAREPSRQNPRGEGAASGETGGDAARDQDAAASQTAAAASSTTTANGSTPSNPSDPSQDRRRTTVRFSANVNTDSRRRSQSERIVRSSHSSGSSSSSSYSSHFRSLRRFRGWRSSGTIDASAHNARLSQYVHHGGLVAAVLVDEEGGVVEATPMSDEEMERRKQEEDMGPIRKVLRRIFHHPVVLVVMILTIVGLSMGLSLHRSNGDDDGDGDVSGSGGDTAPSSKSDVPSQSPTFDMRPTLEVVKERGVLRCGVRNDLGFGRLNEETGQIEGFSVDMCRAVAAALLGKDDYTILTHFVTHTNRWDALATRSIDLLINGDTHTMERDVHESTTGMGFTFSVPYFYDGLRFGGIPHYVDCADNRNRGGDCSDLRICVIGSSTHYDALSKEFPRYVLEEVSSLHDPTSLLTPNGTAPQVCNVMAGELIGMLAESVVRSYGYTGPYKLGETLYSKEPLALVTRQDPSWSDFVNFVLQGLLSAEAHNVTQRDLSAFDNFSMFHGAYPHALADAIATVGNFGQVYDRHFEEHVSRTVMNRINDGSTGLIYSHPFGKMSIGPGPMPDGTLERIMRRGAVRCGISHRDGFATYDATSGEWSGMDVDYCRALSAGIFQGDSNSVEFVELFTIEDRFASLGADGVDVLPGSCLNLRNDELSALSPDVTGEGFVFSQPYFYIPADNVNATTGDYYAIATRPDDAQWSDFVYWIVSATFYAEEEQITKNSFTDMPTMDLFGPDFNWLFRDVIWAVGSYGEMYQRNVEDVFPRESHPRNELNGGPNTIGPQHYPLVGF